VTWLSTKKENGWRLTPSELDRICSEDSGKPRIVVLNYPSNPTGSTYSMNELKELAAVARLHRVVLLSDEIYGELHHKGQHVSISRFYPEGTIISGGLSKWCGAGGWRLGAFAFPRELRWLQDAMAAVASETYTSVSAPIQYAAVVAYKGDPTIDNYLVQSRRILGALGRHCVRMLEGANIEVAAPQGGFYLFPDFSNHSDKLRDRGITTNGELCRQLLEEQGVALLPGLDFGQPAKRHTVRLSYVDFDGAGALTAARQVPRDQPLTPKFLNATCSRVLAGVQKICDWISS
jgi:aspartate aminotransferase